MKNIKFPIILTTAALFLYTIAPDLGFSFLAISLFFVIMNILLIWMVIRVLKDGVPSDKKFDDRFYEDYDHINDRFE